MTLSADVPLRGVEIDAGVIEDARSHRRRRHLIASVVAVLVACLAALIAALAHGAGGASGHPAATARMLTSTHTFTDRAGEELQIVVVRPATGPALFHLYLSGTANRADGFARVKITAASSRRVKITVTSSPLWHEADGTVYTLNRNHDLGVMRLTTGAWKLHVAVTDRLGHRLGVSFTLPPT
jgi:hypothetical protein